MMKKFLMLALLMASTGVVADGRELPANTPLCNIPDGTRLVARANLDESYWLSTVAGAGEWKRKQEGNSAEFDIAQESGYFRIYKGDSFRITRTESSCASEPNQYGNVTVYLSFWRSDEERLNFYDFYKVDKGSAKKWVIGDFLKLSDDKFTFIYSDPNDPYSGMDARVAVDIVMAKITAAFKAEQYADALPHFTYLERKNIPLPESFYFHQIHALEKSGNPGEAKQRALEYLKRYGSKGKYYSQVIEVMARQ